MSTKAKTQVTCYLEKEKAGDDYGFDLHSYRQTSRQFVGCVDKNSPAEKAGLKPGDEIFLVNDVPIDGLTHKQVISTILDVPNRCRLTVSRQKPEKARGHDIENSTLEISTDADIEKRESVDCSEVVFREKDLAHSMNTSSNFFFPVVPPLGSRVEAVEESPPLPSWCRLIKEKPTDQYGFSVVKVNSTNSFPMIDKVELNSIADRTGVIAGLYIVGINYVVLSVDVSYKEIINLIKRYPRHVTLLLASTQIYKFYSENRMPFDFDSSVPWNNRDQENSKSKSLPPLSFSLKKVPNEANGRNFSHENSKNSLIALPSNEILRMSASDARHCIKQRKKLDPRQSTISIVEKYRIVKNL